MGKGEKPIARGDDSPSRRHRVRKCFAFSRDTVTRPGIDCEGLDVEHAVRAGELRNARLVVIHADHHHIFARGQVAYAKT